MAVDAVTRLAAPVSATDQEIVVDGMAFAERLPYRIVVDDEAMLVTGQSQGHWLVRRGIGGSDPVGHDANAEVKRAYALYGTSASAGLSGGGPHDHDDRYALDDHTHAGTNHPDLAAHETLGLAAEHAHPYAADDHSHDLTHDHDATYAAIHDHPYAADDHTHAGGDHPDLATHEQLGLAASDHAHGEYVTDGDARLSDARPPEAHTHAIVDTTNLQSSLDAKAASGHDHDADYAASDHAHTLLDADIPAAIARDTEVTAAIAAHVQAETHGGGGITLAEVIDALYPVGHQIMEKTGTNPGTRLTGTTWVQVAEGLYLVGQTGAQAGGDEIGSATHSHSFTQPDAHAALSHSGATVGNHTFTQPNAHSDHAALSHSAHANAAVAAHAAHTHDVTGVVAHTHTQSVNSATTGGLSGYTPDTSTNTSTTSGYSTGSTGTASVTSSNPSASLTHTVTQPDAHSDHAAQSHSAHAGGAVDAHSVGQASQHGAQSHSGAAVADGTVAPPGYVVYVWERTA